MRVSTVVTTVVTLESRRRRALQLRYSWDGALLVFRTAPTAPDVFESTQVRTSVLFR